MTAYYRDTTLLIGQASRPTRATLVEGTGNYKNRHTAGNGGKQGVPTRRYRFGSGCEGEGFERLTCEGCPDKDKCETWK